jgi:hypothetical protein
MSAIRGRPIHHHPRTASEWVQYRQARFHQPLYQICLTAFLATISIGSLAIADNRPYTTETSYIGGGGSTSTNNDHTLVSSWRQPTQTCISTGGEYDNASGFLGALFEVPVAFRILTFGFTTNPSPRFQVTIRTRPSQSYAIQFADSLAGSFAWQPFLNTNQAVGTYLETNSVPSTFTFADDFTARTSGGPSTSSSRFYRAMAIGIAPTP